MHESHLTITKGPLDAGLIPLTSMASLEFIVMAGQDRDRAPSRQASVADAGFLGFSRTFIESFAHRQWPSDLRAVAQTARPRGRTIHRRIDSRIRAL